MSFSFTPLAIQTSCLFPGANVLWIDGLISSCQSLPTREAFLQLYIIASVVTWKSHFLFCALARVACEHSRLSSLPARVAFGEKFRPSRKTPLVREQQRTAVFAGNRSYEGIIVHVASLIARFGAHPIDQLYKTALKMILHLSFHLRTRSCSTWIPKKNSKAFLSK